ncbi:MAG: DUF3572 domain-containing protein [Pseudomonadota bacterium]
MAMSQESAEVIGLKALAWLAAQDDLLPVFLGSTGASEADVKQQAGDPAFLGAVLDFVMMDDAWVVGFCDANSMDYTEPMTARAALPGGDQVHWT